MIIPNAAPRFRTATPNDLRAEAAERSTLNNERFCTYIIHMFLR